MSTHIDLVGLARGEHNATRDAARNLRDMFAGSLEAFRTHYGLKRRCDAMTNLIGLGPSQTPSKRGNSRGRMG